MAAKTATKSMKPKGERQGSRAGRPTTALITRETAVKEALDLIDNNGLEALSLQSVAQVLNVSAPSLYHHFRNKQELLAQIARALLLEVGHEHDTWSSDWDERMVELSLATRRVLMRHPNAAPLVLRFFPRRVMLQAYENALSGCPYPVEVRMVINELIEQITYGASLFAAAAAVHHTSVMPEVDAERFPHLTQAMAAGQQDAEQRFVEGLRMVLRGFRLQYGGAERVSGD